MDDNWDGTRVVDWASKRNAEWESAVDGMDERAREVVNQIADVVLVVGATVAHSSGYRKGMATGAILVITLVVLAVVAVGELRL